MTINDYQQFSARLDGYKIVNQKVKSDDTDVTYFGYVDRKGNWYIMKQNLSDSGAGDITYSFIKGTSLYSTNWTNRESLTYTTFDATFG